MAEDTVGPCPGCGKIGGMVDARGRPRKYCSKACWSKVVRDRHPECPVCGNKVPPPQIHCSKKCSSIAASTRGKVPCFQCGESVVAAYSTCRKGNRSDKKFCSRNCYDNFRSAEIEKRRKTCSECGTSFIPVQKNRFCSEACWGAHRKGKPKNCVNCGCLFTPVKPMKRAHGIEWISHNGAKTCSRECQLAWISNNEERKRKISKAFKGDKHPLWKGGSTWRSNASHRGSDWKKIAEKVRCRDGYKCRECGMTQEEHIAKFGSSLNVHHIEPFHNFPNSKQANRMSNLITLCRPHHTIADAAVPSVQMTLPLADNRSGLRTGMPSGERHYAAKLTKEQVIDIRTNMAGLPLRVIAERFGVTVNTIFGIRSRRTWKSV